MSQRETIAVVSCEPYYPVDQLEAFVEKLLQNYPEEKKLFLALPFSYLELLSGKQQGNILLGMDDFPGLSPQSFPGRIAEVLLQQTATAFILIGSMRMHSVEQRDIVATHQEIATALKCNITPFLCLHLEKAAEWETWLTAISHGFSPKELSSIVLYCEGGASYEMQDTLQQLRELIEKIWSAPVAQRIRIISELNPETSYTEERWDISSHVDGFCYTMRSLSEADFSHFLDRFALFSKKREEMPKEELLPLPEIAATVWMPPEEAYAIPAVASCRGNRKFEPMAQYFVK
jgi:hypothetical protein